MFYIIWTVGDTLKGLLLCLITNFVLIFMWKAQMGVKKARSPYISILQIPFQILKNTYSFLVTKTLKFYKKSIKTTTYVMNPHSGSKFADKFKMAAITDKYHITNTLKWWCSSITVSNCMSILQTGSNP